MIKNDLNIKLIELNGFIKGSIGKKVRFREEGNPQFTNDIIKDCMISNNEVTVVMDSSIVITVNVHDISITKYEDKEDIFVYGDKCNRFNIYY